MGDTTITIYEVTIKEIKVTPAVESGKYDHEQSRDVYQQRFNTIDVKSVVSALNKPEQK